MSGKTQDRGDSPEQTAGPAHGTANPGGVIPGRAGVPAFTLTQPEPSAIPVLIAVPHAGRAYPGPLLAQMRNPGFAALRLEDRYVDRLAVAAARASGAALLVAHAPRAMIDLNRAEDDIDWEMIVGGAGGRPNSHAPGHRARSGLGLIPRRLSGLGELWNQQLSAQDLAARLDGVHRPYHRALADALARLRARWGAVLLIDLHSMPPLAPVGGRPAPQLVIGDRFGASCAGGITGAAFAWLGAAGRITAHNRPYAGGYVLERHGDPARGVHAVQLEVDRSAYLDARLAEPGAGFAGTADLLTGLVQHLAHHVADLGRAGGAGGAENWPIAAE